jgi:ubiquinone biosynthesis protein COQ4
MKIMTTVLPNNLIIRLNCIRSRIVPSRYSPQISKLPVFDTFAVSSRSVTTTSEPFYGKPREGKKPLSPLQSISLAVYSATNAFLDPERHDMVAALAEVTGSVALHTMHRDMMNDPTGRRILADRPLVNTNSIDIQVLEELPKNTFGYAYAMFLRKNGFDPDERAHVKYIANEELAYVMKRYRQCHDFYHVVTDLPPTVLGELALKYVELFQTGLPVCALSVSVGSMKLSKEERRQLVEEYLPWAIRVGKNNKKWINIYWEEEFQKDLKDFRLELGIDVAPMM